MDLFIKICGMTTAHQAESVAALHPQAVGFIFWSRSRRAVTPEQVGEWMTCPGVLRVGVFVDAPPPVVGRRCSSLL